jgi:hypothetical protein
MPGDPTQPAAAPALRPMRPTELLGVAFGLYRRRWPALLVTMAVAVPFAVSIPSTRALPGPGSGYQMVIHHRVVATGTSWADSVTVLLATAAAVVGMAVVAGAVVRAAVAAVAGEDLGVRRSYRFGAGRVRPLLAVLLMTWLLTVLGLAALFVPGVIVGVLLSVSIPALVVEGGRARAALSRSLELVRGRWWHAFGTILLAWLLLGVAVGLVTGAVGRFGRGWLAETIAQALSITLVTPFAALVVVLLYLDLRAGREGLDAAVPGGEPGPSAG